MSERTAKTYTHVSNRANPQKKQEKERKVVFKSVLDNPFRVRWPSVPVNLQNLILAQVLLLVEGVSAHKPRQRHDSNHRKNYGRKRKADNNTPTESSTVSSTEINSDIVAASVNISDHADIPLLSPILKNLVVGINAVTKRLECQIQAARHKVIISSSSSTEESYEQPQPLKYIFVCRTDVDPPILIDHIPHLVASFNSCKPFEPIKLIPLPKGAEATLATSLNIRRIAVFAFDNETKGISALSPILEAVPVITAPWLALESYASDKQIVPTHIKQVRTSAPKDMKAAKEERTAGRAAAKQKRRKDGK
ncbi:hypothetical protein IW261DRAFT_1550748 [Armillaria novae-zelandiae]|uniref:Uncharacterized protein n=1 Tax=Armillaria novae-zelandiae TaxID=153914 RepID=A0AA39PCI6_9AGAR|nr:hypothetical protein IW261DRAFT_1550748 [Armillaria novae-zelandiae]